MRLPPVLPFRGCDEGACALPLDEGPAVIGPEQPVNFQDSRQAR